MKVVKKEKTFISVSMFYEKSNDNLLIRAGWPILVMVLMSVSLFLAALRSNFLSLKL